MPTDRPHDKSGALRRWIAIGALVLGGVGAFWQAKRGRQERQVSLLLTHLELRIGEVVLDRKELVRLEVDLGEGRTHTLHFSRGAAPQATPAQTLTFDTDLAQVRVRCRFALPTGAELRGQGQVPMPEGGDGVLVLDVGTCGQRG